MFRATVLALEKRSIRASLRHPASARFAIRPTASGDMLGVYIYAFGSQSCATRLVFKGSARLGPTKLRFCSKTLFLWAFRSAFGLAPQNATRFSAVKRLKTKPRMASSGTGPRRRPPVTHFGEKRVSSRALHPPSAARYFVGGIPPPRLVRVRWRITRTRPLATAYAARPSASGNLIASRQAHVAAPFPCVRSFRPPPWARPSAAERFCS